MRRSFFGSLKSLPARVYDSGTGWTPRSLTLSTSANCARQITSISTFLCTIHPCEKQPLYTTKPLKRPTNSHCVFFWFSRGGGNQVIGSTFLHRWGRAFFLYALFKSFCPLDNVYLRKYFLLWDSKTRPPTFRAVHASSLCGRRRP